MGVNTTFNDSEKVKRAYVYLKETEYGKEHDFKHPDELMVSIALAEYRELVSENARLAEKCRALQEFLDDKKTPEKDEF